MVGAANRVVVGLKTACLGAGDVVILRDRGHNTLLFDDEVAGLIIDRVRWPAERTNDREDGAGIEEAAAE